MTGGARTVDVGITTVVDVLKQELVSKIHKKMWRPKEAYVILGLDFSLATNDPPIPPPTPPPTKNPTRTNIIVVISPNVFRLALGFSTLSGTIFDGRLGIGEGGSGGESGKFRVSTW